MAVGRRVPTLRRTTADGSPGGGTGTNSWPGGGEPGGSTSRVSTSRGSTRAVHRRGGGGTQLGPDDVLVLRALGLGDALTGIAALRGVRRAWPGRRIVLAGPPALGAWLTELDLVDAVLPASGLAPLEAGGPGGHVAVNLHGRGPRSHRLLAAGRPGQMVAFACPEAGHPGSRLDVAVPWIAEEHEVDRWCRLVTAAGGLCGPEDLRLSRGDPVPASDRHPSPADEVDGLVVLHPGAASGSRRWPVDRWVELADRLVAAGYPVAVTGSAVEREMCEQVAAGAPGARSVAGTLGLPALASFIGRAGLLVCADTGVAHLATALATPSVLLFGPTPPTAWGPAIDLERHAVIWHGDGWADPHGDELDPALAAIAVDEVVEAALSLLAGLPAVPAPSGRV